MALTPSDTADTASAVPQGDGTVALERAVGKLDEKTPLLEQARIGLVWQSPIPRQLMSVHRGKVTDCRGKDVISVSSKVKETGDDFSNCDNDLREYSLTQNPWI